MKGLGEAGQRIIGWLIFQTLLLTNFVDSSCAPKFFVAREWNSVIFGNKMSESEGTLEFKCSLPRWESEAQ